MRRKSDSALCGRLTVASFALTVVLGGGCGLRQPAAGHGDAATLDATTMRLAAKLSNEDERAGAQEALVAIGAPAIPALTQALEKDNPAVRVAAIETLERIDTDAAVEPLLTALADDDSDVRLRAVEALGTLGDRRAVDALLTRYRDDDDDQVRYECLTSLGKIGDPRGAEMLLAETSDENRYVRMWAMDALCTMNDPRAPQRTLALLQDSDIYVRQQVLRSCATVLRGAQGTDALIGAALVDRDFDVTAEARRQLQSRIANPASRDVREQMRTAARAALSGDQPVNAAFVLADIGDPTGAAALRGALGDPNQFVRHHAAYALGQVGQADAVPALIAALDDPQPLVAATAFDSLLVFVDRGDAAAQAATQRYTGSRFETRLPR